MRSVDGGRLATKGVRRLGKRIWGWGTQRRGVVSVRRARRRRIEGFIVMDDPLSLSHSLCVSCSWLDPRMEFWKCADFRKKSVDGLGVTKPGISSVKSRRSKFTPPEVSVEKTLLFVQRWRRQGRNE